MVGVLGESGSGRGGGVVGWGCRGGVGWAPEWESCDCSCGGGDLRKPSPARFACRANRAVRPPPSQILFEWRAREFSCKILVSREGTASKILLEGRVHGAKCLATLA